MKIRAIFADKWGLGIAIEWIMAIAIAATAAITLL